MQNPIYIQCRVRIKSSAHTIVKDTLSMREYLENKRKDFGNRLTLNDLEIYEQSILE